MAPKAEVWIPWSTKGHLKGKIDEIGGRVLRVQELELVGVEVIRPHSLRAFLTDQDPGSKIFGY